MDEHWKRVREVMTGFDKVPEVFADALIGVAQKGAMNKHRVQPEWCEGARRAEFCAADWLAHKYWRWRAGGYVPFSYREALNAAEA